MKAVRVGNGRVYDVPTTWREGEDMITHALRNIEGRGSNTVLKNTCALVAYGLFGERWLAADPTTALAFLLQHICQRKGGGLG